MVKIKDWTGQKFGRITFLRRSDQTRSHAYKWEGICDCGNRVLLVPGDVKRGQTTSCGCYKLERITEGAEKRRKYSPQISSARKVWQISYKDGNLTFEEFLKLSQQDCYYCGVAPHRVRNPHYARSSAFIREHGDFVYNGIDRIDSSRPHDRDNVVPCCKLCNQAKMNLSIGDFMELISRIYHHRAKEFKEENETTNSPSSASSAAAAA